MEKNERGFVRRILELPKVYNTFKTVIRSRGGRHPFSMVDYISDGGSCKRILDLGCGTANILDKIKNETCYVGIDYNEKYIEDAKARHKNRGNAKFYCTDLNSFVEECTEKYDIVLMIGVMHHICDEDINNAMVDIKKILADDGEFISADCCFTKHMNPIAWILCSLDRGRYVRRKEAWISLMKQHWGKVWYEVRTDTLSVPYSLIVFKNSIL